MFLEDLMLVSILFLPIYHLSIPSTERFRFPTSQFVFLEGLDYLLSYVVSSRLDLM